MKKLFVLISILGMGFGAFASLPSKIWVAKIGSDTRGSGTLTAPYLTLAKAKAVATAGQTIHVMPGTYAENNLLKKGVNYYGEPGANILYIQTSTNEAGWGIFDDRPTGATTNIIEWPGDIVFVGYTNVSVYDEVAELFDPNSVRVASLCKPMPPPASR
ncbi:MAG: DUF1565 domain-containing protein [Verrucomicrobiota bacterium]